MKTNTVSIETLLNKMVELGATAADLRLALEVLKAGNGKVVKSTKIEKPEPKAAEAKDVAILSALLSMGVLKNAEGKYRYFPLLALANYNKQGKMTCKYTTIVAVKAAYPEVKWAL
mgnify:CR=1 FL=1